MAASPSRVRTHSFWRRKVRCTKTCGSDRHRTPRRMTSRRSHRAEEEQKKEECVVSFSSTFLSRNLIPVFSVLSVRFLCSFLLFLCVLYVVYVSMFTKQYTTPLSYLSHLPQQREKDVSRPSRRLVPLPQSSLSATLLRASIRSESLRIKSSVCPSSTPLRNQLRLELKLSRTRCSSVSRSLGRDAFAPQGHQCQQ